MIVFVVVCGNCSVEVLHYFLPESAGVDLKFELLGFVIWPKESLVLIQPWHQGVF